MDSGSHLQYAKDRRSDTRSTEELISLALTEVDEQAAWEPVSVLHFRGTREVLDAALRLCASECPKERELGVNILGQLGVPERTFPEDALAAVTAILRSDLDPDVLSAAAVACGHLADPRVVEPLLPLKDHPNEDVRAGVVFGLLGQEDERAIDALIQLSADVDSDVRDWATFGLAHQIETDTPAIRAALLARIADADDDTRGEAFTGLALRGDERVVEPLIEALSAESVGSFEVEAARLIGDPRLYPALLELKQWWAVDVELLDEALARCRQS